MIELQTFLASYDFCRRCSGLIDWPGILAFANGHEQARTEYERSTSIGDDNPRSIILVQLAG